MKTNYHTHTERCRHAQGCAEEYIKAALAAGVSILGFSEHAPFSEIDFGMRMPFTELQEYVDEINALTQEYAADIILKKSLEIEYIPEFCQYYEDLLTKTGMDYLLLGEHFYRDSQGDIRNITEAASTDWYTEYANAASSAMKTGYFKMIAHPDIYMMSLFAWDENCDRAADLLIDTAVSTGTILEYNANGLRREERDYPDGTRRMYPHERFWELVSKAQVAVIVGSDCHNPKELWDGAMDTAFLRLEKLGIQPVLTI